MKPNPTASTHVHVEERFVREAPNARKEARTLYEEALDVGAVDVVDAKAERPSLSMTCRVRSSSRIGIPVDEHEAGFGRVNKLGRWACHRPDLVLLRIVSRTVT